MACLDPVAAWIGVVYERTADAIWVDVGGGQWRVALVAMTAGAVDVQSGERVRLTEYEGGGATLERIGDES